MPAQPPQNPPRSTWRWLLPASISSSALIHGIWLTCAFLLFQSAPVQTLQQAPAEPVTLTTLVLPEPVFTSPEEPEPEQVETPTAGGKGPAPEVKEEPPPEVKPHKPKKPRVARRWRKKKPPPKREEPTPPPEEPKAPEVKPIAAVTEDPAEAEGQQDPDEAPTLPDEASAIAAATPEADDAGDADAPEGASARAGTPGGAGPGSGNAAAGAGQGDGPDLGALLRGYKRKVARELRRSRRYPRAARRRGLQGTVIVELVVNASGGVVDVRVARSSGPDVLDDAALKAVRSVGRLPAPPHELGWTRRAIRIPFNYKLT